MTLVYVDGMPIEVGPNDVLRYRAGHGWDIKRPRRRWKPLTPPASRVDT